LLQHGHAHLFGGTGVDGGFVHHDIALFEHLPHGLAGFDQRRHVGAIGRINRCGHGDDEDLASLDAIELMGVAQLTGGFELIGRALQRVVFARLQLGNALGVDVEAHHRAVLAKFNGQRKANVT